MVADNKKQPDFGNADTIKTSSVNDVSNAVHETKFPSIHNKKFVALLVIFLLLIIGLAHYGLHIGEKVYAQAAGHKIYKSDIQTLVGNTKGISDRQAATTLANKYLSEAMAKEAKITVTNDDLVAQYGSSINTEKKDNKYGYQVDVNNAYFNKLLAYNAGLYKGRLLITNFSAHIAFQSPFLDIQQARDPLLGNATVIAADKKYAHDLITNLYSQVKSRKITFDQAIEQEHNDKRVGLQAYQTLGHSGPFDTSNVKLATSNGLIAPTAIKQKIANMKDGQMSAPFAVKVANSLTDYKNTTESYYIVVRMDSSTGGHSGLTYNQYLAQAKKSLGYKVNV